MENRKSKKLFVLGLDCATPQLVFGKYLKHLPCISKLMAGGSFGYLESSNPPITVPAWMSMFTGKDPGQLGFYGFTDRLDYSYNNIGITNYSAVGDEAVWDYLGREGLKSIVIGVPPTYPPRPISGIMVSDFLTPDKSLPFTYPKEIKEEINKISGGEYAIDVSNFMMEDKEKLLKEIYDMTRKRFEVIRNFIVNKDWNLFISVEIGLDRLHHGFWKFCFDDHIFYKKGNGLESSILDYYKFLDEELSKTLKLLSDDTRVMIVSDHGAKGSKGSFCLNQWLINNGYLAMKDGRHVKRDNIDINDIDWFKTKAWAKGGYYGRIFLNIAGREPMGIVKETEVEDLKNEIISKLSEVADENGNKVKNTTLAPENIYKEIKNIPPDLLFYAGNLDFRVSDAIGDGALFSVSGDTGVDNANHDFNGIVISCKKGDFKDNGFDLQKLENIKKHQIKDVAPTILDFFELQIPSVLSGKKIIKG